MMDQNNRTRPGISGPHPNTVPFPEEAERLTNIQNEIDDALRKAETSVEKLSAEYRDSKKYMAERRGELDPHEMFQTELLLKQTDRTEAFATEIRDKLIKMKDSPYFARIDFHETDGECERDKKWEDSVGKPEVYYIGRSAFRRNRELLVIDWRAPAAGMFYECEPGPAFYDAPAGRVKGELLRKRQFQIKGGILQYAAETSEAVRDEILLKELGSTSDEKMKSIISTIQKEQNRIIRNDTADTMIIQGVAGSGKTSVALHRIAYLLYRFRDRLSSRNVTILSPNKVFGDYISNVIPELGEEPIYELSFTDIAEIQLDRVIGFETDRDPAELQDEGWRNRSQYKSTLQFAQMIKEYAARMSDWILEPEDYMAGQRRAEKEWIRQRYRAYQKYPVKMRLEMTAEDIQNRLLDPPGMGEEVPGTKTILKSLNAMLKVRSTLALYQNFYRELKMEEYFVMPDKNTLEWADVAPFLYLQAVFAGIKTSAVTRHLVVDEMQDYTPIQYEVLNLLFPCRKTILGDFGQIINPNHLHSLHDLKQQYPDANYVELNKSYRSTCEIMEFAGKIQHGGFSPADWKEETLKRSGCIGNAVHAAEAVERHGEPPAVAACVSEQERTDLLAEQIRKFEGGNRTSLGIILKTDTAAKELYDCLLRKGIRTALITQNSLKFENGVSIAPVRLAKGLEFDEVIIADADSGTYCTEYDRNLLYVACTRAMHRLSLIFTKECTAFIEKQAIGELL